MWMRILIVAAAAALLFVGIQRLPVRDWTTGLLGWMQTLGPMAPFLLILIYVIACVLLIPGSLITLGAGFLFGLGEGYLVVAAGSVVGSSVAFILGRTLARDWIEKKVMKNAKFRAVDRAVGERGFYIVFLSRLSPVFPFTLLNYFYGVTSVSLRDYVIASWIGMIPGTLMYVYLGSLVKNLTELAAGGATEGHGSNIFFWLGLVATVAVAVIVTRIARQALNEEIADGPVGVPMEERSHA
jgi:uncharacterized membrane protein YdjX (TVP38/TMEM64 family)